MTESITIAAAFAMIGGLMVVARLVRQHKLNPAILASDSPQQQFHLASRQLQVSFLRSAAARGKPRGLRWLTPDWLPEVTFAEGTAEGQTLILALAPIVAKFEPIEGGGMEGIEYATAPREAIAIFQYRQGIWGTAGQTIFNLSPDEYLQQQQGTWTKLTPPLSTPNPKLLPYPPRQIGKPG
jgi:hypothetical protein